MKHYINIIQITCISLIVVQCSYLEEFEKGNGEMVTVRRSTSDFEHLKIGGNFDVLLKKGESPWVQINTDENLIGLIDAEVHNGILEITQQKKLISKKKIELIINYVNLKEVRVMGAALIKNEGYLECKDLKIRMDGVGTIDLKVQGDKLEAILSGAGVVRLAGEIKEQELNLTGTGKLEAFDLESKECKITVGGIGGAEIFVTDKLEARIEGIGGIEYAGNPQNIITEINGLGKINRANEN